ncbi:MAG: hypothetical protein SGCHY_001557 [Lobulomycetales sp.]
MVAYELMVIATEAKAAAREILKTSALFVLDNGGVVRELRAFGDAVPLAYKMKRHQVIHTTGRHIAMTFDSSPNTMRALAKSLGYDEKVIRHTMIKRGEKLKHVSIVDSLKNTRNIHQ